GHLGAAGRTAGDDVFEHFAHGGRGFLADDLTEHLGFVARNHIAVRVEHLPDDVRLEDIAAVDQGRDAPHQLDGGDFKGLTPGGRDQVGVVAGIGELNVGEEEAVGRVGKVNA